MERIIKLLLLIGVAVGVGCQRQEPRNGQSSGTKSSSAGCFCAEIWEPVCGENGKTYSNKCFAGCASVSFKKGECTATY